MLVSVILRVFEIVYSYRHQPHDMCLIMINNIFILYRLSDTISCGII
jgi:hypothetical protein